MTAVPAPDPVPAGWLRRALLGVLAVGLAGTLAELLLLGHWEDAWQWVPLALLGAGLVAVAWHARQRGPASLRVLQAVMAACVAAGVLGVVLHYRGNAEFELERVPELTGWPLFREAMTGATPALAPGAMVQLGLLGLLYAFRHPALARGASPPATG